MQNAKEKNNSSFHFFSDSIFVIGYLENKDRKCCT